MSRLKPGASTAEPDSRTGPTPGPAAAAAATLRAVAIRAGVSKSVVSRVLQGSPHVSDERRGAVEKAIRDLGYRPNGTARSLTQRRTHAVGVLVNDLRQPWFVDFLEGLNATLHAHDLHAFVGDGRLDRASDERLLTAFTEMRVDGLVLAGTLPLSTTITQAARWLPTVAAGSRDFDLPGVDVVAQDDWLGVELALDHLFSLGHRRIAHIAGHDDAHAFVLRRRSYESWMRRHGLERHIAISECDTTETGGYQAARRLLDGERRGASAVFVVNDLAAVGALAAFRDHHLTVPIDVSVTAFDNSVLARMRYIGLTSVDVAPRRVGELSGKYLVERIAQPDMSRRELLITPTLDVRGSTAEAPTAGRLS
jgi:DNA-binding LacI/PurR family transcriptional regulator